MRPPHRALLPGLIGLLLLIYAVAGLWPSWQAVYESRNGRDFATYHYAAKVALAGGDPYETRALSALAREEGTRASVHPYFYPPPFLLSMVWVGPLSLETACRAWFWLNQGLLLACLVVLRRWLRAPWLLLAAVACLFTPIPDNAKMGQANLLVVLLSLLGLWRSSGVLVGLAAMAKMSPALYLAGWGARGRWKPVLMAVLTAILLSVVSLPLVPLETQLRFYTEILPGFSSGHYHGLRVPITLPANHSIPDLLNQLWPGESDHELSPLSQRLSQGISLLLLAGLSLVARKARDPLGLACAFGALTVLLVITPVYTYEHHLSMLLLPLVAAGTAIAKGRLGPRWWVGWGLAAFFTGWPLYWLRPLQKLLPPLSWLLQESKFFALLLLMAVCVAGALAPRRET